MQKLSQCLLLTGKKELFLQLLNTVKTCLNKSRLNYQLFTTLWHASNCLPPLSNPRISSISNSLLLSSDLFQRPLKMWHRQWGIGLFKIAKMSAAGFILGNFQRFFYDHHLAQILKMLHAWACGRRWLCDSVSDTHLNKSTKRQMQPLIFRFLLPEDDRSESLWLSIVSHSFFFKPFLQSHPFL